MGEYVIKVVYYESLKRELKTKPIKEVGAMKDYKLELRNLHASHALEYHHFLFFPLFFWREHNARACVLRAGYTCAKV